MKRSRDESEEQQSNKKIKLTPKMDQIANSPGLQHIIENIFLNLDSEDLATCQFINKSCKQILSNPLFWIKKWRIFRGLSKKNQEVWTKAIQMSRGTNFEKNLLSYIKTVIKNQEDWTEAIQKFCRGLSKKNREDWTKTIQMTRGTILEKNVLLYIKRHLNLTGRVVDVPCFMNLDAWKKLKVLPFLKDLEKIQDPLFYDEALKENYSGILQILAPLIENPFWQQCEDMVKLQEFFQSSKKY